MYVNNLIHSLTSITILPAGRPAMAISKKTRGLSERERFCAGAACTICLEQYLARMSQVYKSARDPRNSVLLGVRPDFECLKFDNPRILQINCMGELN
jgi:hypothetical protein